MSPFKFVIILGLIVMAGILFSNADQYMSIGVSGAHGIVNGIPESQLSKNNMPTEVNGNSWMEILDGGIGGTIAGK